MTDDVRAYDREGRIAVPGGGEVWYGVCGDLGQGPPPLLVIHGGPGLSHDYLRPMADLAEDRAVVFYDQLDAGNSDRLNDPANWQVPRFLDEIEAVTAALGLERYVVFGNSWGGTLVAAHAARQPRGLCGVILSSPLIDTETWIADNAAYRAALPQDVQDVMDAYEARGDVDAPEYQAAVQVFYQRHFCRVDPWPSYLMRSFEVLNPDCYVTMWGPNEFTCIGVLKDYDGSPGLGDIAVPALLTCGRYDEATPRSTERFAGMVPGADFMVFEASSHMAFIEERSAYMDAVRGWLGAIP